MKILTKKLGRQDYLSVWRGMKTFTQARDKNTPDEIWCVQHDPVFTQGQAGKAEHILDPGNIPVVQTDRGGQVTYHGPGQLVVYPLINLVRRQLSVHQYVSILEQSVVALLSDYRINAVAKREARGVYIDGEKICSIGLKIKKGCSYHGLAFNVEMDLEPFSRINPCGFNTLKMTQLSHLIDPVNFDETENRLCDYLIRLLN